MSDLTVEPLTVTIGELTDVPAPGDPIRSQIINELAGRVVQRFASKAALDAQWPTAPNGSVAVTLDTSTLWLRRSATWLPLPTAPQVTTAPLSGTLNGPGPIALGGTTVTAVPYPRRLLVTAMVNFGGTPSTASAFTATLTLPDSSTIIVGGPGTSTASIAATSIDLAANMAGAFNMTGGRSLGSDVATVYADTRLNKLSIAAWPIL